MSDNVGVLSNCPLSGDTKILYWSDYYKEFKVSPIKEIYHNCERDGRRSFKVLSNGKEINCNVLLTFRDDNNDINYIVYTDGTLDEDNEPLIYASRYVLENNSYILKDIENDYEWDLIDNMLDSKYKGIDN